MPGSSLSFLNWGVYCLLNSEVCFNVLDIGLSSYVSVYDPLSQLFFFPQSLDVFIH